MKKIKCPYDLNRLENAITHAEKIAKIEEQVCFLISNEDGDYDNHKKCGERLLEQEPCEDEYIKVPKKALKYRTAGMVAYNAEWLKNHFDIERAVICGEQEPCEDCVRLEQAEVKAYFDGQSYGWDECRKDVLDKIRAEIMQVANQEKFYDEKWALGLRHAVKIIDKYAESEG